MCNWGWLEGPVGGILVQKEQKKKKKARKEARLANQRLQEGLAEKEREKNEALDNINEAVNTDPIKTMESLTDENNTTLKPKRTISTLAIPNKVSGLNVR